MKKVDNATSRRRVFTSIATAAVSVSLLALRGGRDAKAGNTPPSGPACLLKGTKMSTPAGERAVEDLQIGDDVLTLSGPKAVKWIGHSRYTKDKSRQWREEVMPIHVARGAIDDLMPHSDLYLSPSHCVFFNGSLIPVKHLVNGSSIRPAAPEGLAAIEYYHIEFDTHEVIFAEGAQVESFMEAEFGRESFSNFVEYERQYGREQPRKTSFAPILSYRNRRQRAAGLARSIVSNVVDVRDQIQIARDQIAKRTEILLV